ncbi:hypothetical protein SOVF_211210, partial [Spinacia oleracea]
MINHMRDMYYSEELLLEGKTVPDFIDDIVEASGINAFDWEPWVSEEPYQILLALIHLPQTPKYQILHDKYANVVLPTGEWNRDNHEFQGVWLATILHFGTELMYIEIDGAQRGGDAIDIDLPSPVSTISSVDSMGYEGSSEPDSPEYTPREYPGQYDYMAIDELENVIEAGYPEFEVSSNQRNI